MSEPAAAGKRADEVRRSVAPGRRSGDAQDRYAGSPGEGRLAGQLRPSVETRPRRPPLPHTRATRSGSSVPLCAPSRGPFPALATRPISRGTRSHSEGAGPPHLIFASARSQLRSVVLGPCCRRSHLPPVRDGTKGRASHPRCRGNRSGSLPPGPVGPSRSARPQSRGRHSRTSATTIRAAFRAASASSFR